MYRRQQTSIISFSLFKSLDEKKTFTKFTVKLLTQNIFLGRRICDLSCDLPCAASRRDHPGTHPVRPRALRN